MASGVASAPAAARRRLPTARRAPGRGWERRNRRRRRHMRARSLTCRGPTARSSAAGRTAGRPRSPASFVLRQLHFFSRRLPALALARLRLHRGGGVLQERELILRVLLGAEPAARRPGWPGISRSQSIASICLIEPRPPADRSRSCRGPATCRPAAKSTTKMIFSFGSRMTSVLSEWFEADVGQLERGAAELDGPARVHRLVGERRCSGPSAPRAAPSRSCAR